MLIGGVVTEAAQLAMHDSSATALTGLTLKSKVAAIDFLQYDIVGEFMRRGRPPV
jgi:hypothetical protein